MENNVGTDRENVIYIPRFFWNYMIFQICSTLFQTACHWLKRLLYHPVRGLFKMGIRDREGQPGYTYCSDLVNPRSRPSIIIYKGPV